MLLFTGQTYRQINEFVIIENVLFTRSRTVEMADGLDMAKVHLKTIFAQVQTFLDMHQVVSAGPFLYAFVQEVSMCYLVI